MSIQSHTDQNKMIKMQQQERQSNTTKFPIWPSLISNDKNTINEF